MTINEWLSHFRIRKITWIYSLPMLEQYCQLKYSQKHVYYLVKLYNHLEDSLKFEKLTMTINEWMSHFINRKSTWIYSLSILEQYYQLKHFPKTCISFDKDI